MRKEVDKINTLLVKSMGCVSGSSKYFKGSLDGVIGKAYKKYVASFNPTKEMTVADIEKAVGHSVKVVK
jgi:hypothetical protein